MRYFRYKVILILVIFKMKKIWLLTTLLIGSILLTGCNTNLAQNEPSENDNQLPVVENSNQTMNLEKSY